MQELPHLHLVSGYLEHLSYAGIYLLLALYVVPIPEEIALLAVGYVVADSHLYFPVALVLAILGVITADNIWFQLGRIHSKSATSLINKFSQKQRDRYGNFLQKYTGRTIVGSRFIPGLRIAAPAFAGSLGVRRAVFQFYNTLAIMVYVPIFVGLGFVFQNEASLIAGKVETVKHLLFISLLFGLAYLLTATRNRGFMSRKSEPLL